MVIWISDVQYLENIGCMNEIKSLVGKRKKGVKFQSLESDKWKEYFRLKFYNAIVRMKKA
jgi:hypothetical protein